MHAVYDVGLLCKRVRRVDYFHGSVYERVETGSVSRIQLTAYHRLLLGYYHGSSCRRRPQLPGPMQSLQFRADLRAHRRTAEVLSLVAVVYTDLRRLCRLIYLI
jgi:hypothetical protein